VIDAAGEGREAVGDPAGFRVAAVVRTPAAEVFGRSEEDRSGEGGQRNSKRATRISSRTSPNGDQAGGGKSAASARPALTHCCKTRL